jgi:hypothetical protein
MLGVWALQTQQLLGLNHSRVKKKRVSLLPVYERRRRAKRRKDRKRRRRRGTRVLE